MWDQPGFAVVSDVVLGTESLPVVHAFELTEGEAKIEEGRLTALLPEHLRVNLRILHATLTF